MHTHKEAMFPMTRTRLRDRLLPDYTHGEELFNMISHIVGGGTGVVVLILCLWRAILRQVGWAVAGSILYGLSCIQLYTISSVYHGLRPGMGKRVLQVIDHCTIYLFIAGTYTPIMLTSLRPVYPGWAWTILGIVWGLAVLAIVLNAIDLKRFKVFSMICYLGMGWCVIIGIRPMVEVVPADGLLMILAGGIVYTIGAVLYGLGKKKRYMHSVFHLCCLIGSILQALSILIYVL